MQNIDLLNLAKEACENAYAPYSKFFVGACALYDTGNYYKGCNVENASYGLTICAERSAMATAVAAGEKGRLVKLAVFCKNMKNCMPCGACRQWMSEFKQDDNMLIITENEDFSCNTVTIGELLPQNF
jgi:cytidine deaminase